MNSSILQTESQEPQAQEEASIPQPEQETKPTNEVYNFNDSPDKLPTLNDDNAESDSKVEKVFGKYGTMEDAEKGYNSATKKIQEQGTHINELKKQLEEFKPMEEQNFDKDSWGSKIEEWKKEEVIPKDMNLSADIPEIDLLIGGMKTAQVSEKQAKDILKGVVERQGQLIKEAQERLTSDLGEEGMAKVKDLTKFAAGLNEEDKVVFGENFSLPYVSKEQVDLFHRLLCNSQVKQSNIPTDVQSAPSRSASEIYIEILDFQNKYEKTIAHDPNLTAKLEGLWKDYTAAKKNT